MVLNQTECRYDTSHDFVSVTLSSFWNKKEVVFIDTGVKFYNGFWSIPYAKSFDDVVKIEYIIQGQDKGIIQIECKEENDIRIEQIGCIHYSCWDNIKALLHKFPDSKNIPLIETETM